MIQGQDHVYVVFTLPALNSPAHRSRTIQPGPWGPDVQANGLMGLVGHNYVQKGAAQCLVHHDDGQMASECFLNYRTMMATWRDPVLCKEYWRGVALRERHCSEECVQDCVSSSSAPMLQALCKAEPSAHCVIWHN